MAQPNNNLEKQATEAMAGRPIGLFLIRESANLLLEGLKSTPQEKRNVLYHSLVKQLTEAVTIWDRRIKNSIIIKESKKR